MRKRRVKSFKFLRKFRHSPILVRQCQIILHKLTHLSLRWPLFAKYCAKMKILVHFSKISIRLFQLLRNHFKRSSHIWTGILWEITGERHVGQRTGDSPLTQRRYGGGNRASLTNRDFAIIFKKILHAAKETAHFHTFVLSASLEDTGKKFAQGNLSKSSTGDNYQISFSFLRGFADSTYLGQNIFLHNGTLLFSLG